MTRLLTLEGRSDTARKFAYALAGYLESQEPDILRLIPENAILESIEGDITFAGYTLQGEPEYYFEPSHISVYVPPVRPYGAPELGFKLKMPKLKIRLPKLKMPKLKLKLPKLKLPKLKLPSIKLPKIKLKLPKIDLKALTKPTENLIKGVSKFGEKVGEALGTGLEMLPGLLQSMPGMGQMMPGMGQDPYGAGMEDPMGSMIDSLPGGEYIQQGLDMLPDGWGQTITDVGNQYLQAQPVGQIPGISPDIFNPFPPLTPQPIDSREVIDPSVQPNGEVIQPGGIDQQTLLIAGGVALAGVAFVVMNRKKGGRR